MGSLSGYAAMFNSRTNIGGQFYEQLAPGAFARTLGERDVIALVGHDKNRVLGRTSSGTLRLSEDAVGLHFELDVADDTADGRAMLSLVGRRDVKGCSFAFSPVVEDWDDRGALPLRTLIDVNLYEITLTAWPAYPSTTVAVQVPDAALAPAALAARQKMHRALAARHLPR